MARRWVHVAVAGVRPCGHSTYRLIGIAYASHSETSITVGVGCNPSMPVINDARIVPGAISHVRSSAFVCPNVEIPASAAAWRHRREQSRRDEHEHEPRDPEEPGQVDPDPPL